MHLLAFAETIQLFPDGTLFIHIAIILLMIWILNRTVYRPINRIIEAREKNKGGHSSEAASILSDVNEKESRYTTELLDTRSQGYELIEKEQKKAAAAHEQKIVDAKSDIASQFETGKAEIESQTGLARAAINKEAEKMAESIAANILRS
ncbi:MAG: hypothetical protein ACKVQJ_01195 [Pyrinomonadaceae bacterium]